MSALLLRVVCGWCGCLIKPGAPNAPTSHGICPACIEKFTRDAA